MLLKRIYDTSQPRPRLMGVKILHAGLRQNFSIRLVDHALADGWMELEEDIFTICSDPPVRYRIQRRPGIYCCHCDAAQTDSTHARDHLTVLHPSTPSPDAENPAGYRQINHYECERIDGDG